MDLQEFLKNINEDDREWRIFEEFIRTKDKLQKQDIKNTIVMFGSARTKHDDSHQIARGYYSAAYELANRLAMWSKRTFLDKPKSEKYYVCTGGGGGIMEAANKGAAAAQEPTLGFNIILPYEQVANPYIPEDLVFYFHYFFIRKFYFAFLAKAFVIFPGGFGTFDELFEILTLAQTQKMQKIIPFVIFGKSYFEKILNFDMLVEYGYISQTDKELYILTDDVEQAFRHITQNIEKDKSLVSC
jgi:uncharacterized protein (TIGR00730 family)